MIKYKTVLFAIMIALCITSKAQPTTGPGVPQIMQTIYQNYDSLLFLSFDVRFSYESDTVLGKFDSEQMDGTYTMAGKKAKYRLGDIDFMQNDSFFIAVYNRDKLIFVDEPKINNAGSGLPMRQQIDSLITAYSEHYSISTFNQGTDTGVIQLLRADSLAQFDRFSITYDNRNKMLYKVFYEYPEPVSDTATLSPSSPLNPNMFQKKRLTIQFSNYRFDNSDDELYDENNYIWFEDGVCKPVAKYNDFKIYYSKPATGFYQELLQ